jgi:glycine cleavage system pyridoxal-binding protein P
MQVLAGEPNGEATVRTLIKKVPDHVNLTDEDYQQSPTREHERMWEQRVRNLKSHNKTPSNVIGEGYVEHVARGRYRLTEAGWGRAKNKGWV